MKKLNLIICLLSLAILANAQDSSSNYYIVVNGDTSSVGIGGKINYTTKSGEQINITLLQKEILTYTDDVISFNYPSEDKISKKVINDGVTQISDINPDGTVVILQEYSILNPDEMIDLMLEQLTKEKISYGYSHEDKNVTIKLKDGEVMKGKTVVLKLKDKTKEYTAVTWGLKDTGIMLITAITENDKDGIEKEKLNKIIKSIAIVKQ